MRERITYFFDPLIKSMFDNGKNATECYAKIEELCAIWDTRAPTLRTIQRRFAELRRENNG